MRGEPSSTVVYASYVGKYGDGAGIVGGDQVGVAGVVARGRWFEGVSGW